MPVRLDRKATERSTFPIELLFYDGGEGGPLVSPSGATWSLVDRDGAIVNGRDDMPLAVSGGAALIVLQGADLAVPGVGEVERRVTVRGTYTSARYGSDLPIAEEFIFTVQPLAGVTPAGA
jgi:hypothetical protein